MVLPLLALVAFVLIMFGKAIWVYIEVTHAANEGARLASVNQPQDTSLQSYLTSEYALPSGSQIAICYPDGTADNPRAVGEPVQVVVYTNASWVPFANIGQIKGAATMRLEQDTSTNTELDATSSFNSGTKLCGTS